MHDPDLHPYGIARNTQRAVEILTPGEFLYLSEAAADRLERLLEIAVTDTAYMPDIHRFSLCFESAGGNMFTMPGPYWVAEFRRRLGPVLKACDIQLAAGTHGALSQWDREVWQPRQNTKARKKKDRSDG
jgi:hypothetical protein